MKIWKTVFWLLIIAVILLTVLIIFFSPKAEADTNINSNLLQHFSWNDIFGWADFYETDSVTVEDRKLSGYASSSVGDISLDCATTRQGNICGQSNYGISNNGTGGLSGYGWNETIGWISFNCSTTNSCASANYGVGIDQDGDFHGFAWNDVTGWISFSCLNPGGDCGAVPYEVNTATWRSNPASGILESSIFDTATQAGAILNNIVWQGEQPAGTCVKFQIAVSYNSNGSWQYKGPGENTDQYFGNTCPGPDFPIEITGDDRNWVNNQRYLRYKVFLTSNAAWTSSPTIENIILNWSK